jgi:hypothetical protein
MQKRAWFGGVAGCLIPAESERLSVTQQRTPVLTSGSRLRTAWGSGKPRGEVRDGVESVPTSVEGVWVFGRKGA